MEDISWLRIGEVKELYGIGKLYFIYMEMKTPMGNSEKKKTIGLSVYKNKVFLQK